AAPERSTRASIVRALPQSAAPLRIGDHMPETVVITGASAGSGARRRMPLRRKGSDWADGARHPGAVSHSNGGQNLGGRALTLPLDVADPNAVEAAADSVENRSGPIDIWVNCAIATIFAPFTAS